jgi:transcriptional regulator with XRE-family HTH domain
VEDEEDDKDLFLRSYGVFCEVRCRIEDTRQVWFQVHALPEIAMLLRQLDEVGDTTGTCIKENRGASEKEAPCERTCLDKRKPIMSNPVSEGHASIIPSRYKKSQTRPTPMTAPQLPNYIRTFRKRAGLTQEEVAFILGSKSSAGISRHERFKQTPELQTLIAYELLFRAPVRNLFSGTHHQVEKKLLRRIRLLVRKLAEVQSGYRTKRKIAVLTALLEEPMPAGQA